MSARVKTALILSVGLGLTAVVLLVPLPAPWRGIWQSKLIDFGHVPLFALLTLLLWFLLGPGLLRPVLIALTAAALAEIFQAGVGRSAGLPDFILGTLGTLAAAAGIRAWQARDRPPRAAGWLLLLAAALAWPLFDTIPYVVDAHEGARDFPTLADFRTGRQLLRWRCRQAELTRAGRLDFLPGPEAYPSAALHPIVRDFSGYRWFCCSFSVEGGPLRLVISIRGGPGKWEETTHYQTERVYPAGKHVVRLDLPAVAPKAFPRPLDLSDVSTIQFFIYTPEKTRTIYLRRIWLEE